MSVESKRETPHVSDSEVCATFGCDRPAAWTVSKEGQRRKVCRRCMEEIIAWFGWSLVRGIYLSVWCRATFDEWLGVGFAWTTDDPPWKDVNSIYWGIPSASLVNANWDRVRAWLAEEE